MPNDKDLFEEEQTMVAMSFGDHIEELRVRLVLALLGLGVGVVLTFVPYVELGKRVMRKMQEPAVAALKKFYDERAAERAKAADDQKDRWLAMSAEERSAKTRPGAADAANGTQAFNVEIDAVSFAKALAQVMPDYKAPPESTLEKKKVALKLAFQQSNLITAVAAYSEPKSALVSLAPLETFMIYFSVCMVSGLVLASPWVFYQIWEFVAAGLYRHERHYVKKFLPFSLGLFLGGVALCFFLVLPYTLMFLLEFNVWLGIEPTLRISEWMGFATIMPLVFGVCFQTPLVMMLLERLGIVTVEQFKEKRKYAILIMVVVAAIITPTGDPFTLGLLAIPMVALYELGIVLVRRPHKTDLPARLSH